MNPLRISVFLYEDKNQHTFCCKICWKEQPYIFCLFDKLLCVNICTLNMRQCNYKFLIGCVNKKSLYIKFSNWAKINGYIDLRVTTPLLYKDSLKSQTWLFLCRSFAGPSVIFKFSHSEQIWGLQSIYWAFLRVAHFGNAVQILSAKYQWKISSHMKFSCPNLLKSKKNCFGGCTEGYIALTFWVVKVKVILYHCCVVLLRFCNFFLSNTRNIIHFAVIRVKIWMLHKKNYSVAIFRITLSPEMDC